jgi:WD repeat-containing protein 55
METKCVPDEICCGEQVFDLKFHPSMDVVATALIDGSVKVYRYNLDRPHDLLLKLNHHRMSCRGVEFDSDGQRLFSISSDGSWACVDTMGSVISTFQNAHQSSINKSIMIDDNTLVTGDDGGCVKLWDIRSNHETSSFHVQQDFISDFGYNADAYTLLCTSGDATLAAHDIRKKVPKLASTTPNPTYGLFCSDDQESELQCLQVIKGGRKVICGTEEGVILIFSWNRWGDCSDRYPGHPNGVDCMMKIDENTVLTGSSDGLIRVVAIQPNKVLGVIGDHNEFPVEGMRRSRCGNILGSYAHDDTIRFWDISMFEGDVDDSVQDGEDDEDEGGDDQKVSADDDVEDMSEGDDDDNDDDDGNDDDDDDDDSDDEDDDSDSDDGGGKMPAFKIPSKTEQFYADL